jgi:phosphohistidine phosphatase
MSNDAPPGCWTPAGLMGENFILSLPRSSKLDLSRPSAQYAALVDRSYECSQSSADASVRSRPDQGRKAMKSLHLLRHAKSSWKDPGLNDHDRPLSKRGRQTAKMMAAYLRRAKIAPDLVICSTAMRARQTLNPIAKAKKPPKVVLEREIYGGAQRALWEQLWNLPESAKSVLLIGHNPALQDLALELAHADLNKLPASAGGKFPTGAMASFRFDGAWKALEPHGAVLASYITPKAIADSNQD